MEGRSVRKEKAIQCDTPFIEAILVEELPNHFQPLWINDYNGSSNPEEHLGRFENATSATLVFRWSEMSGLSHYFG